MVGTGDNGNRVVVWKMDGKLKRTELCGEIGNMWGSREPVEVWWKDGGKMTGNM